ncbi:MAG: GLPGLI family protein [Sediminibacterium sp.]|nr:GLPGLI family protein [Sediminibacterium sp.]
MKSFKPVVYCLLFCITSVSAQESALKAEYEMVLRFSGTVVYSGTLLLNPGASLFTFKPLPLQEADREEEEESGRSEMHLLDTMAAYIHINRSQNLLQDIKKSLYTKEIVMVKEPIPHQEWILEEGFKIIGKLTCKKAVTSFRGRKYTVWYCPDLPYGFGPWKLNGLPGLIVEATEEEGQVGFYLKQLTSPFRVTLLPPDQGNCKMMSYAEYRKKLQREEAEFQQRILSRLGREMNASISVKRDDIERE